MYKALLIYFLFLLATAIALFVVVLKLNIKRPVRFVSIILFLIIAPAIFGYFYFSYFTQVPEVIVPDVLGMREKEAVKRIEKMGLVPRIENRLSPPKLVTNQRPDPGKIVKAGRIVSITIGEYKIEQNLAPPITGESND